MSTHESSSTETVVTAGRPVDLAPVVLGASCLESIAPSHLRDLKAGFAEEDYLPAELIVKARFSSDASLAMQPEFNYLRKYVHAVTSLGVGCAATDVAECCRPDDAESVLAALGERARRESVAFELRDSTDS